MFTIELDMQKIYSKVCGTRAINSRFADATRGLVELEKMGWVRKTYPLGSDESIEWEFRCLGELQGLGIVPELDEDEGWDGGIVMECIDFGAGLFEYVQGYFLGIVDGESLEEIFRATRVVLEEFWEAGWTHGDLHTRNIVVGLGEKGWQAFIIDFSHSYSEENRAEFAEMYCLIEEELPGAEGDEEFLKSDLWLIHDSIIGDGPVDAGFSRAMNELF